jgi:RimJ/RimL family protein N-acetyltransferase
VEAPGTRLSERLRLEPISSRHADDLWRLHRDAAIAQWYVDEALWSPEDARRRAESFGADWATKGVSKWIAYDRATGELVGRGGLSRAQVAGQERLEVGWGLLGAFWGCGLATEIGRAALTFAFGDLDAHEVIAFTEVHNRRSRAVMERLGMTYVGNIVHRGLVEGFDEIQNEAPFALYRIGPPPRFSTRSGGGASAPQR